ncbi:MAG: mechanosensitive ion channel family protein [Chthoniobacterales bacterium]
MLPALLETQKAAITVVVLLATFFVTLALGRILKRRAGVQLGVLYKLFCLAVAFYAALATYGFHANIRTHLGALVVLLSTGVLIALLDRYLWDMYFEERRQTPIPKFLRHVVALVIFLITLLFVLNMGYHAEAELRGLLAGSSIVAIVLAFAMQNLLGGMISGISLQISRPFRVGDWLQIGERFAEVMEMSLDTTRLRTNDDVYLDVPNNEFVRQTIINLHYPTPRHAMRLRVGVEYTTPPNRVKDALYRASSSAEGVLRDPPPRVFLVDFADSAVTYEIKYWIADHAHFNDINDAIHTNIWYEFKRQRITIPFPARTLHVQRRHAGPPVHEGHAEARAILRGEPLFQCLPDGRIDGLLKQSLLNHFGRGERMIEEGARGESMFILLRGTAHVSVAKNGSTIRVGVLRSGDCFGEMSLLTGERRMATVRADGDCYVMEIGKPLMAEVLRESPGCLDQLSALLAKRKMETEGIVKDATHPHNEEKKEREYTASFVDRLKTFFEL